jgi:hypothetical protein
MWWCLMSMDLSAQDFTEDALDDLEDLDSVSPFADFSDFSGFDAAAFVLLAAGASIAGLAVLV